MTNICRKSIRDVVHFCRDPYAKTYARAALDQGMNGEMEGEELRTQLLYIICNTGYWRGQLARQTKLALKTAIAELGQEQKELVKDNAR
jgi:hypothetical protein